MSSCTNSPGDEVLAWREKIVSNRIGELIGPFNVLHYDECCKIIPIDQDGVIKRYSTSEIRLFLEQPSMIDVSITERKIEDRHDKAYEEPNEPEVDDDSAQLNFELQSYGEQSITDDRDNVTKNYDQEIIKEREILEQNGKNDERKL